MISRYVDEALGLLGDRSPAANSSANFAGPFSGGRHQFMVRDDIVVTIPNPHGKDIGIDMQKAYLGGLE